jgi:hypothetical protein
MPIWISSNSYTMMAATGVYRNESVSDARIKPSRQWRQSHIGMGAGDHPKSRRALKDVPKTHHAEPISTIVILKGLSGNAENEHCGQLAAEAPSGLPSDTICE